MHAQHERPVSRTSRKYFQERIATRFGLDQKTIHYHLGKKAELPFSLNTDLSKGFTVSQVAEKHGCPVGPEDRTEGWTEPSGATLLRAF